MSLRCLGGNIASSPPSTAGVWGLDQMLQLQAGGVPAVSPPPVAPSGSTALGTLWAWGLNSNGQCGNGSLVAVAPASPVQIGAVKEWQALSAGTVSSHAIKGTGTLWSWGGNSFGQLGQGNATQLTTPTQVGALTTWQKVSCRYTHALAIKTDGTLWAWGDNTYGQCGTAPAGNILSPTQIGALTTWAVICTGNGFSLAVKVDGTLWMCGLNTSGQLGQGDYTNRSAMTQVGTLTDWLNPSASVESACGGAHVAIVKTGGALWGWGSNSSGQMAQGGFATMSYPTPTRISMTGAFISYQYLSAACGAAHTVCTAQGTGAVTGGLTIMAVQGLNTNGQLGTGSNVAYPFSVVVLSPRVPASVQANQASTLEVASLSTTTYQYSTTVVNARPVTTTVTPVYTNAAVQYGAQFGTSVPTNYNTKTYLRAALGGLHTLGVAQ